tara:strand:- start:2104 stop:2382 length:279 start_codon:yes stop_codon:yes gene_type:complete
MQCSVSCKELIWRWRYIVSIYIALCTQEFFRLGILAWLEFVYGVFITIWIVAWGVTTVLAGAVVGNLPSLVIVGVTGFGVLSVIETMVKLIT